MWLELGMLTLQALGIGLQVANQPTPEIDEDNERRKRMSKVFLSVKAKREADQNLGRLTNQSTRILGRAKGVRIEGDNLDTRLERLSDEQGIRRGRSSIREFRERSAAAVSSEPTREEEG